MIVLRALDGTDVSVGENAITLIAGPYPHDLGSHTYVSGVDHVCWSPWRGLWLSSPAWECTRHWSGSRALI
jgi:hypothetical protein